MWGSLVSHLSVLLLLSFRTAWSKEVLKYLSFNKNGSVCMSITFFVNGKACGTQRKAEPGVFVHPYSSFHGSSSTSVYSAVEPLVARVTCKQLSGKSERTTKRLTVTYPPVSHRCWAEKPHLSASEASFIRMPQSEAVFISLKRQRWPNIINHEADQSESRPSWVTGLVWCGFSALGKGITAMAKGRSLAAQCC